MDLLEIRHQSSRSTAWLALALAGAVLQGCAEKPGAPQAQHARLFASDLAGGAKHCIVPNLKLDKAKEVSASMQVGNDGGWCGITLAQDGKPYDAGLLMQPAGHGAVYIHPVGDDTRIDYTPDPGASGADSFVVRLLPGNAVLRVNVTVAPR